MPGIFTKQHIRIPNRWNEERCVKADTPRLVRPLPKTCFFDQPAPVACMGGNATFDGDMTAGSECRSIQGVHGRDKPQAAAPSSTLPLAGAAYFCTFCFLRTYNRRKVPARRRARKSARPVRPPPQQLLASMATDRLSVCVSPAILPASLAVTPSRTLPDAWPRPAAVASVKSS